jgi:hypothetical protein
MPEATGYAQEISALTQAIMPVLEQKNYTVENLPDFVNFDTSGEYMDRLVRGRTRSHSSRNMGFRNGTSGFAKAPSVNVSRDMYGINNYPWLENIEWGQYEIEQASRGIISYDVLAEKVEAVKKAWDLDKQDAIFAGVNLGNITIAGLLNIKGINTNNTLIPSGKAINNLSSSEMYNFVSKVLSAYADNSKIDAMPDRFIVPLSDYFGWGNVFSATPDSASATGGVNVNRSIIEFLEETFKKLTRNPDFKILPVKYSEAGIMNKLLNLNVNRYALYQKKDNALLFHIPQELKTSAIVPTSGTTFTMSAYGQIAGISCGRPENILYIDAGVE